jgi:hypothetical protein
LTNDPEEASLYGKNIMPFFLDTRKPLLADAGKIGKIGSPTILIDLDRLPLRVNAFRGKNDAIIASLKHENGKNQQSAVAFSPEQVLMASGAR